MPLGRECRPTAGSAQRSQGSWPTVGQWIVGACAARFLTTPAVHAIGSRGVFQSSTEVHAGFKAAFIILCALTMAGVRRARRAGRRRPPRAVRAARGRGGGRGGGRAGWVQIKARRRVPAGHDRSAPSRMRAARPARAEHRSTTDRARPSSPRRISCRRRSSPSSTCTRTATSNARAICRSGSRRWTRSTCSVLVDLSGGNAATVKQKSRRDQREPCKDRFRVFANVAWEGAGGAGLAGEGAGRSARRR